MPKKPDPAPEPVAVTEQTTITRQLKGGAFLLNLKRSDRAITGLDLIRHGARETPCRSCDKPNPAQPLVLSRTELDELISLLTQARDEKIPALEKYGVEE